MLILFSIVIGGITFSFVVLAALAKFGEKAGDAWLRASKRDSIRFEKQEQKRLEKQRLQEEYLQELRKLKELEKEFNRRFNQ